MRASTDASRARPLRRDEQLRAQAAASRIPPPRGLGSVAGARREHLRPRPLAVAGNGVRLGAECAPGARIRSRWAAVRRAIERLNLRSRRPASSGSARVGPAGGLDWRAISVALRATPATAAAIHGPSRRAPIPAGACRLDSARAAASRPRFRSARARALLPRSAGRRAARPERRHGVDRRARLGAALAGARGELASASSRGCESSRGPRPARRARFAFSRRVDVLLRHPPAVINRARRAGCAADPRTGARLPGGEPPASHAAATALARLGERLRAFARRSRRLAAAADLPIRPRRRAPRARDPAFCVPAARGAERPASCPAVSAWSASAAAAAEGLRLARELVGRRWPRSAPRPAPRRASPRRGRRAARGASQRGLREPRARRRGAAPPRAERRRAASSARRSGALRLVAGARAAAAGRPRPLGAVLRRDGLVAARARRADGHAARLEPLADPLRRAAARAGRGRQRAPPPRASGCAASARARSQLVEPRGELRAAESASRAARSAASAASRRAARGEAAPRARLAAPRARRAGAGGTSSTPLASPRPRNKG